MFYLVFLVLMVNMMLLYKKVSFTRSLSIIKVNGHSYFTTPMILQTWILNKNILHFYEILNFPRYCLGTISLLNVEPKSNDKLDQLRSTQKKSLTPTNNINSVDLNKLASSVNQLVSTVNKCKCFVQLLNEHKKMW